MTTGQSGKLGLQAEVKRGSHTMEPQAPLTGGGELRPQGSEFFTSVLTLAELAAHARQPPAPCAVVLGEHGNDVASRYECRTLTRPCGAPSPTSGRGETSCLPEREWLGDRLHITRWLRILPGQRYVGCGQWQGQTGPEQRVLAKLLAGRKAARQYRAEYQGARLLAQAGVATPKLLASGCATGQGGWLLFDWLDDAESLAERWQRFASEPLPSPAQQTLLREALTALAQLHQQGLWQTDLHLDNLLHHQGKLWVIDGASVRKQQGGGPLSARRAGDNLALFFAQLPPDLAPHLPALWAHYQQYCPNPNVKLPDLLNATEAWRQRRLRAWVKKTIRDCSAFAARVNRAGLQIVRRDKARALQPLLADLDTQLNAGQLYKTGGAATVARIDWQGRALVVKRYNVKNLLHWLKRCWRPSRAVHSWRAAHRFEMLGIATPRPLAVVEERRCGLRQRAYLITEHCDGPDLLACLTGHATLSEAQIAALVHLMERLLRARVSHGDLKGHNLIWHADQWFLIDLDAARQHRSRACHARAYRRDRARLLRNLAPDSPLHAQLDARLPRGGAYDSHFYRLRMMTASISPPPGNLFLVTAPSGAGKSSLVRALLAREAGVRLSVSCTTRAPRVGEVDGREYRFVTPAAFARLRDAGALLEWAEVHGHYYGTPRDAIDTALQQGEDVLLEIDWQGARQVRQHYPQVQGIFVLPPSLETLAARLRGRGQDDAATIARRLQAASGELTHADEFEYVIINQEFSVALSELCEIVRATRRRFASQAARHPALFAQFGLSATARDRDSATVRSDDNASAQR